MVIDSILKEFKMYYIYKYKWMNKILPRKFVKLPGYKGIEFLGKEYFVKRINV